MLFVGYNNWVATDYHLETYVLTLHLKAFIYLFTGRQWLTLKNCRS